MNSQTMSDLEPEPTVGYPAITETRNQPDGLFIATMTQSFLHHHLRDQSVVIDHG